MLLNFHDFGSLASIKGKNLEATSSCVCIGTKRECETRVGIIYRRSFQSRITKGFIMSRSSLIFSMFMLFSAACSRDSDIDPIDVDWDNSNSGVSNVSDSDQDADGLWENEADTDGGENTSNDGSQSSSEGSGQDGATINQPSMAINTVMFITSSGLARSYRFDSSDVDRTNTLAQPYFSSGYTRFRSTLEKPYRLCVYDSSNQKFQIGNPGASGAEKTYSFSQWMPSDYYPVKYRLINGGDCPDISGDSGSGSGSVGDSSSCSGYPQYSCSKANCSFANAKQYNGWGYDSTAGKSCPTNINPDCSWADASKNDGWGYASNGGYSCEPKI